VSPRAREQSEASRVAANEFDSTDRFDDGQPATRHRDNLTPPSLRAGANRKRALWNPYRSNSRSFHVGHRTWDPLGTATVMVCANQKNWKLRSRQMLPFISARYLIDKRLQQLKPTLGEQDHQCLNWGLEWRTAVGVYAARP
jgi:hypothetical protein